MKWVRASLIVAFLGTSWSAWTILERIHAGPPPTSGCVVDGYYVHRSWPTPNTNYRPMFLTPRST